MKYLILAGNAAQAEELARIMRLERAEWKYLHSVEQMLGIGLGAATILRWGTWAALKYDQLGQIHEMARVRELPILIVERYR